MARLKRSVCDACGATKDVAVSEKWPWVVSVGRTYCPACVDRAEAAVAQAEAALGIRLPVTFPLRRGRCPRCGAEVALRADGSVRSHRIGGRGGRGCVRWSDGRVPPAAAE